MYHSDEPDSYSTNHRMGGNNGRHGSMSMTIEDIKRISANTVGVKVDEIEGRGKTQKVSLARQIAIYFTRQIKGVEETGRIFNRNHSNVTHTCKRIEDFLECDREFGAIIRKVGEQIK